MARLMMTKKKKRLFLMMEGVRCILSTITMILVLLYLLLQIRYRKRMLRSASYFTPHMRRRHLHNLIFHDDITCINQLRMNRATFGKISDAQTHGSASKSIRKRSKKNADPLTEGIIEVSKAINKFVDGSLVYLSNVGQALKEDNTPSREVAKSLHKMKILTLTEVMTVAKMITTDEYMTSIFLELPQEKRVDMVLDLLKF